METAFAGARAGARTWSPSQNDRTGRTVQAAVNDGVSSEVRIRVDTVKTEEAYLFYADVPGVKIRDVKVSPNPCNLFEPGTTVCQVSVDCFLQRA